MQGSNFSLPNHPSSSEIKTLRNEFSLNCSNCFTSVGLKKCSRCQIIVYCSLECQKADWPRHKPGCATKEGNISVKKFAQTLFANPLLRRYLEVLVILALDLLNPRKRNQPFKIQILLDFEPTNILDFFKLFQPIAVIDSRPMQGMLQVSNVMEGLTLKNTNSDKLPIDTLQWKQKIYELFELEQRPAGFIQFFIQSGKEISSMTTCIDIHEESLEIARQAKDVEIPILFNGETTMAIKELSPSSCVELINALIRQDTKNQWLLRTNLEKFQKQTIKDAASLSSISRTPGQDESVPPGSKDTSHILFVRCIKERVLGQRIYWVAALHLGIALSSSMIGLLDK